MPERLPAALLAGLVGWCLGWASAWCTDWLQAEDDLPRAGHGALVRDGLVQVGSAAAWLAAPLLLDGPWWRWAAAGAIATPLVQVTVTDLRHRYVYTLVAGVGVALGVALGVACSVVAICALLTLSESARVAKPNRNTAIKSAMQAAVR